MISEDVFYRLIIGIFKLISLIGVGGYWALWFELDGHRIQPQTALFPHLSIMSFYTRVKSGLAFSWVPVYDPVVRGAPYSSPMMTQAEPICRFKVPSRGQDNHKQTGPRRIAEGIAQGLGKDGVRVE